MFTSPWIRMGAVATLWVMIAGAGAAGWTFGKSAGAREAFIERLSKGTSTAVCAKAIEAIDREAAAAR
jgi:hypothetical protein